MSTIIKRTRNIRTARKPELARVWSYGSQIGIQIGDNRHSAMLSLKEAGQIASAILKQIQEIKNDRLELKK